MTTATYTSRRTRCELPAKSWKFEVVRTNGAQPMTIDSKSLTIKAAIADRKAVAARNAEKHPGLSVMIGVEVAELPYVGPIVITEVGDENMFFTTSDGMSCYCKCF